MSVERHETLVPFARMTAPHTYSTILSIYCPTATCACRWVRRIANMLSGQNSQEVCPHNNPKFVQITSEEAFRPRSGVHGESLIELMSIDQTEFSRRFKNSPVKRAKRRGLLRNVAVALGNWGSPRAVPVLTGALSDGEPLVRGHAAWALGRI